MSFCCFFTFSLSSLISHSRLQSNLFFPECIIQAAEPGCRISQRPGIRASFCSLSGRGTSHPGPCPCLSCQSAVVSAPQRKPAQPLGTKKRHFFLKMSAEKHVKRAYLGTGVGITSDSSRTWQASPRGRGTACFCAEEAFPPLGRLQRPSAPCAQA